jgi:hypothetical protein
MNIKTRVVIQVMDIVDDINQIYLIEKLLYTPFNYIKSKLRAYVLHEVPIVHIYPLLNDIWYIARTNINPGTLSVVSIDWCRHNMTTT